MTQAPPCSSPGIGKQHPAETGGVLANDVRHIRVVEAVVLGLHDEGHVNTSPVHLLHEEIPAEADPLFPGHGDAFNISARAFSRTTRPIATQETAGPKRRGPSLGARTWWGAGGMVTAPPSRVKPRTGSL